MDIIIAFLNYTFVEEIFKEFPYGFLSEGDVTKACKLSKALYRLKQASKA